MQLLPHSEYPASHTIEHALDAHTALPFSAPGQASPQSPQCAGSLLVSTHSPPHSMRGATQVKSQVPLLQTGLA